MNALPACALELIDVSHRYDEVVAVDRVSLRVTAGEVVCLLGPSGCGKSTILRLAAGLEVLQQGRVLMADRVVADSATGRSVPPEQRGVGLVFQDFALFPHLTVARNVGFGLGALDPVSRERRIADVLEQVEMTAFAQAYPHSLSGGQQQRVALARALAPEPAVLLLDEPFSGLDARLREQIRDDTLHVLKRSRTATLMVTHDPDEAMFMADRIYLLQAGQVVQSGSPDAIYRRPVSSFVARFFTATNDFAGVVRGGKVASPFGLLPAPGFGDGAAVEILIRPESLQLVVPGAPSLPGPVVAARVDEVRFLGSGRLLTLSLAGTDGRTHATVRVRHGGRILPEIGGQVSLQLDPAEALVFPQARGDAGQGQSPFPEIRPLSGG